MKFLYEPAILEKFPGTTGGVIFAQNLSGSLKDDGLWDTYLQEQVSTLARIGNTPLSEIPSLKAWRSAFRSFGVNPTRSRSAAEALLRRLTKKGDIPSINPLVDIMNLVSIRYALPAAAFDTREIPGGITVRFADGTENFIELGAASAIHPEAGEVVFVDDLDKVVARRWCWRQSAESASRTDTLNAIITIEAQHENGRNDVERAVADTIELLGTYLGGDFQAAILDQKVPSFEISF